MITPKVPIMHEETREELYRILGLLCKHVDNYAKVIELVSDLIPQGMVPNDYIFFRSVD